jgi:enamine deaminase RidA (YjgF/YER057c/UK114 family)
MIAGGPDHERDDPLGGVFGAARAVRAGDFVFTSAVAGVVELDEGVPVLAATFAEQLRIVGERLGRRLRWFGCSAADIVDATVCVHPSVEIKPGTLLDRLQEQVFCGHSPALSLMRAANVYDDALVSVKVTAYKPRDL